MWPQHHRVCVLLVAAIGLVLGNGDYCAENTFASTDEYMQFTKEPSLNEYAIVGGYKGVHCCAKGYRSIEWFKDGRPYPWPGTVSQLFIYPQSENQTVHTPSVTPEDAGIYKCLLKNDSVVKEHSIRLVVFDKVPDEPKITFISQDQEVILGDPARLFCEAFVGRVDLPDAHYEATWTRSEDEAGYAAENLTRINQKKVTREDHQIQGTYLLIDRVELEDFGGYECKISKPGSRRILRVLIREKVFPRYSNPNQVPCKKIFTGLLLAGCVLVLVFLLYRQCGLRARVQVKDHFGRLEDNDGKIRDVLILYSAEDHDLVVGVLQPKLENDYNYKCLCQKLPRNMNNWFSELSGPVSQCRRIVAVLSPAVFNGSWQRSTLYDAIKHLQSLGPPLLCVALQEVPVATHELKNEQGETLTSLLRSTPLLPWNLADHAIFWLSLRLHLPPRRKMEPRNPSRLTTSESQDCLDQMV